MQDRTTNIIITALSTVLTIVATYILTTSQYWIQQHQEIFPMLGNIPFLPYYLAWLILALCVGGIVYFSLNRKYKDKVITETTSKSLQEQNQNNIKKIDNKWIIVSTSILVLCIYLIKKKQR